jgi:hypothetical protein
MFFFIFFIANKNRQEKRQSRQVECIRMDVIFLILDDFVQIYKLPKHFGEHNVACYITQSFTTDGF